MGNLDRVIGGNRGLKVADAACFECYQGATEKEKGSYHFRFPNRSMRIAHDVLSSGFFSLKTDDSDLVVI